MPHIHELIDFVVSVIIVNPNADKVLLAEHPRYQKWLPIGGHIELTDDSDTTLLKEVKEECGLEIAVLSERPNFTDPAAKPLWTPAYVDIHDANPPHKHHAFIYFAKASSEEYKQSEEHTSLRWFTLDEIQDPANALSESIKFYCKKAIEKAQ